MMSQFVRSEHKKQSMIFFISKKLKMTESLNSRLYLFTAAEYKYKYISIRCSIRSEFQSQLQKMLRDTTG